MAKISKITAREILTSGGTPTVEATVVLDNGTEGTASVAFGASAGKHEAATLTDGGERYEGKGMLKAVENIENTLAKELVGMEVFEQVSIDKKMIELDGTPNKSKLGGNAILAVSLAVARAGAEETKMPLYAYLKKIFKIEGEITLPKPMVVMIEGGKHADNSTDLQEYLVTVLGNKTIEEAIRMEMEIYEEVKKILTREGLSTNVGNEGAFAPSGISSNEKPIEYLLEAINAAGYVPGVDVGISIDAAASEFFDTETKTYNLKVEQKQLNCDQLIEYYLKWMEKYPFVSWEDMMSEDDPEGWKKLMERAGDKVTLIGDDLTVTNKNKCSEAIAQKMISGMIIKPNQAGTLTETVEAALTCSEARMTTVVSHRGGGETNDTFISDLGVALGCKYIKCGPTRGERVAKYNRLMEVEDEIGQ